jgi:HEPN domain-containing protein
MSADLVIAGYVYIAKQDLDGARLLNRDKNRNAAYLCEQAAEKLIRAVLTSEGIQAGIRHELPDMVSKIPDANPVKPLLRAIEHLDAYATAYRYPSPRAASNQRPAPTSSIKTSRTSTARNAPGHRGVDLSGGPARGDVREPVRLLHALATDEQAWVAPVGAFAR